MKYHTITDNDLVSDDGCIYITALWASGPGRNGHKRLEVIVQVNLDSGNTTTVFQVSNSDKVLTKYNFKDAIGTYNEL